MTDIGILGLDTSHAEAFAEVLSEREASAAGSPPAIAAVWDGGTVRTDDYVESFCATYGSVRIDDPADMTGLVDAALVLAVDWERHVDLARPFLEAGVPTLVDKPVAGSIADLDRLERAGSGTTLFGGSALPYHPSFGGMLESNATRTIHLAGYHDFFYYRVHIVDTARRIATADWAAVDPIPSGDATAAAVTFADGTWATLRFDGPTDEPVFGALDVADRTRTAEVGSAESTLREMYEPYLETFLERVYGLEEAPTVDVLDSARLLLAVEAALSSGQRVTPDSAVLEETTVSSAAFLETYEPYY